MTNVHYLRTQLSMAAKRVQAAPDAVEAMRPLSYLSAEALDVLLSRGMAIVRRIGCGYDDQGNWRGRLPGAVRELVAEWLERINCATRP